MLLSVAPFPQNHSDFVFDYFFIYLNPVQPRILLQLKLVGILMINLFLTLHTTQ
jgi:hypothetical protein